MTTKLSLGMSAGLLDGRARFHFDSRTLVARSAAAVSDGEVSYFLGRSGVYKMTGMTTPRIKSPDPTDKHVGLRIKARRLMLRMSQEKLGDALGLTFQQVQKYEKGVNRIGASRLQHIAHLLEVPVSFFFDGGPSARGAVAHTPSYVIDFTTNKDGVALARAFMSIKDSKLRHCIARLVEEIADPR